ncbi:MAG: flagellar filament capping protein FliD [Lachnospiraceae bacterium]|nr:flagellar filament capping protein FliD [Lachnospiraceae bacterium]
MPTIDTAYHYYLSTYAKQSTSRYDSHKKSELRTIYNNIVKINKDSPLYKIKRSEDVQKFAIDIKESTRIIKNVVASLSDAEEGIGNAFQKKLAFSSQDDVVSANYLGGSHYSEDSDNFTIEVQGLATPQINQGAYLDKNRLNLKPGTYSFDLENNTSAYEFQFTINPDDTNFSTQNKLANLITNADIGLKASVVENADGLSSLQIESLATGISPDDVFLFSISPQGSHDSMAAIDALGIDHVSQEAHNAVFLLNGTEQMAYENTFLLDNNFELTLHGTSPVGQPAVIGFKTNADAMAENIQTLVDSYNSVLHTANKYSGSQPQSVQLYRDMSGTAFAYQKSLENIGLIVADNGEISIDKDALTETVSSEDYEDKLSVLNDFKNLLNMKANNASLDPMRYVDKILVTYKNPGKTFVTPYITSIYSGMMMDEYC